MLRELNSCWRVAGAVAMCVAGAAHAAEVAPTGAELAAASRRTQDRLQREGASWTVVHTMDNGQPLAVDIISNQGNQYCQFRAPGIAQPILTILARDGIWYVRDGEYAYKARPYEAYFQIPMTIHTLARSSLSFVTQPDANLGRFEGIQGDVASFLAPLPPASAAEMRSMLTELQSAAEQFPDALTAETKAQMVAIERRLREGDRIKVGASTGIIMQHASTNQPFEVRDFRWNPRFDRAKFEIEDLPWKDLTQSFSAPPQEIAMCNYVGAWRPGGPKLQSDAMLVELTSGRMRRVPFQHGIASVGCFSKDRTKVFVSGAMALGGMGLFEIELTTGENRPIVTSEAIGSGALLFPHLSPDGKTVAMLGATGGRLLDAQVWLIDVESGRARKLGEPLDTSHPTWLPDGSGLIVWSRKNDAAGNRVESSVCRLGLDGKLTVLRNGGSPMVLGTSGKILFDGRYDPQEWMVCDLDGSNPRLLLGGLHGLGFPSPSADGRRILMMRFGGSEGPRPVVVDVESGRITEVNVPQGLWSQPGWN